MATGILGQSAPTALTNTTVYTVPASITATFNVNICNRGTAPVYVRLAIAATGTPTISEWIEWDAEILSSQVLERTGLVAQAGENVVVFTDTATVSISVYGYEV